MIRLFANRDEHPLADEAEADRLLKELPSQDPAAALDNAAATCDSLTTGLALRPEYRLQLLLLIDEAVLAHTRRLARDYLLAPRQTRAQEFKLWQINQRYWISLAEAYEDSLRRYREGEKGASAMKSMLPVLCARHLSACGNLLKWQKFRYGQIDGQLWGVAGQTWLEALRGRFTQARVQLYQNVLTSTEAEYLRLLILHSSSPDNLLPVEIEIAERLIAHLLPEFSLTDQARPENVYWIDPSKPLPPTRLARIPEITPNLRFYATGSALKALNELRGIIEARGSLPVEINFGAQYAPRRVLQVITHLAECWAPVPPMRSHERRRVKSRMNVVGRFDPVCLHLFGHGDVNGDQVESWVVEDVSQGGFGALISTVGKEWLIVGALLAMQPEGGSNWLLGVVRRLTRVSEGMASVGIETLSRSPVAVMADSQGLPTPVILLEPPDEHRPLRIGMAISIWEEQRPLLLDIDGRHWRVTPQSVLEIGASHVVGVFRVQHPA